MVKLHQRVFGFAEAICVNNVFQAVPYSLPGLIWGILREQIVLANFAGQQNRLTPSESPPGMASENERRRIPQTRSAQSHAKHPHHWRHRPNQQRHHRPPTRPLQPHRLHRRPGQRLFQIRKHLPFIISPVGSQRRRPPLAFAHTRGASWLASSPRLGVVPHDLTGCLVDRHMELEPGPPFEIAVLAHLPLPLPIHFQARRIHYMCQRAFWSTLKKGHSIVFLFSVAHLIKSQLL